MSSYPNSHTRLRRIKLSNVCPLMISFYLFIYLLLLINFLLIIFIHDSIKNDVIYFFILLILLVLIFHVKIIIS